MLSAFQLEKPCIGSLVEAVTETPRSHTILNVFLWLHRYFFSHFDLLRTITVNEADHSKYSFKTVKQILRLNITLFNCFFPTGQKGNQNISQKLNLVTDQFSTRTT